MGEAVHDGTSSIDTIPIFLSLLEQGDHLGKGRKRGPMITERIQSARAVDLNPETDENEKLTAFLRQWLGAWPPPDDLEVVSWPGHDLPGWDGGTRLGLGVESPDRAVLSLSPSLAVDPASLDLDRIAAAIHAPDAVTAVPALLGHPGLRFHAGTLRWSDSPSDLPAIGEWVGNDDPRIPAWLRAFNGDVLVAWDRDGRYAAGVGRKMHNRHGQELAVGTDPANRGRGLASGLVAQAARRVLADGAIPIYLHDPANVGSRRVAEAAGFPDRGWRILGLH